LYSGEDYLVGRVYVNEDTSDRIEFVENAKIIFTCTSDIKPFWHKNQPYEYSYSLEENDIYIGGFKTSSEAFHFPYRKGLRFSGTKEEILSKRQVGRVYLRDMMKCWKLSGLL
jgi:hypothetical protein